MTRLSTYMSEARDHELPGDVIERVKRHVLDTVAAMVSGSELAPGRAAIQFARAYSGKSVATIVDRSFRSRSPMAADLLKTRLVLASSAPLPTR